MRMKNNDDITRFMIKHPHSRNDETHLEFNLSSTGGGADLRNSYISCYINLPDGFVPDTMFPHMVSKKK